MHIYFSKSALLPKQCINDVDFLAIKDNNNNVIGIFLQKTKDYIIYVSRGDADFDTLLLSIKDKL